LREAHPPSEILQAKRNVITGKSFFTFEKPFLLTTIVFSATTITFNFIGPKDDGGLPTRAYAVQYREDRRNWNEALNKTWPVGECKFLANKNSININGSSKKITTSCDINY